MRKQLTDLSIEKLRPPTIGRLEIFDTIVPAMAVRVTPNGAKSFVVRARVKGQPDPIRVTLGDARGMRLTNARQAASDVLRVCRAGDDPRAIIRAKAEEVARQRRDKFEQVAEDFIKAHVSTLRSKKHIESAIRHYLIKPWGTRSISSITPDDVAKHIREIIANGSTHTGRRILAHAKRLFRWAAAPGRSHVKVNPCADLKAKDFEIVHTPRDMVLSQDHMRLIWKAADEMGAPYGQYFKMLLLSGQRRDEIARMSWAELDLDGDEVLNLPADRMKAKRPHEVPLSAPMVELLKAMREDRGAGDYVFSTTLGKRPISGFSKAKLVLDAKVAQLRVKELEEARDNDVKLPKLDLPAWRLHDIRRTVRTGLGAIPSVPHDIRELVIAHIPPALVGTYDRHGYRDEKRQALELWALRLKNIVAPPSTSNVFPIPTREQEDNPARAKQAA